MILFDCERMRKPFTGQYTYAKNLAEALVAESVHRPIPIALYLPTSAEPFQDGVQHKTWHRYHKLWMPMEKDIQLYHVSNPLSLYVPRPSRIPLLTTIHDLNFLHYDTYSRKLRRHTSRTRNAFDRSDRIVTISRYSRQDILELYGDQKEVDVVYNGIRPYDGPVTPPSGGAPDGDFILSVCRITKSKNLAVLPALLSGNGYKLVFVGKIIEKETVEEILAEARKWGVADRVIFTGPVAEPVKHWYLQNCAAFVFPSWTEGFGLPVLEVMQYYKPVFCSDRTSLPEVGGDVAFYFNHDFEPRAMQEEFEAGMDAFSAGAVPPEKMRSHLDRFTWENAARQYYDIYLQIL